MKKLINIVLAIVLASPVFAFAASTDVSVSDSAIITVGGYNLTVSGTANFDSIVVNDGGLSFSMSQNSRIIVQSADRITFSVDPIQNQQGFECASTYSALDIMNNSASTVTVSVTPLSTVCVVASQSSETGTTGGGGGGGSTPVSSPTPTPTPAPTPSVAPSATPTPSAATPSSVAQIVSPVFNTALKYGITSDEVKRLQELFASDSEIYPEGIISGWFGQLTRKAVQKFQCKYDIVCSGDEATTGYGSLGPKTRVKIQEVFSSQTVSVQTQETPSTTGISSVFASGLAKGTSNSDVKRLQQLLNSDPDTVIAQSGTGSVGNETNYFGSLTEKAVQKFQNKYGIAKPGDPGYGYVGPKTRAKLQEVFK